MNNLPVSPVFFLFLLITTSGVVGCAGAEEAFPSFSRAQRTESILGIDAEADPATKAFVLEKLTELSELPSDLAARIAFAKLMPEHKASFNDAAAVPEATFEVVVKHLEAGNDRAAHRAASRSAELFFLLPSHYVNWTIWRTGGEYTKAEGIAAAMILYYNDAFAAAPLDVWSFTRDYPELGEAIALAHIFELPEPVTTYMFEVDAWAAFNTFALKRMLFFGDEEWPEKPLTSLLARRVMEEGAHFDPASESVAALLTLTRAKAWEARLFAVYAAGSTPFALQDEIVRQVRENLVDDPHPLVRKLAAEKLRERK